MHGTNQKKHKEKYKRIANNGILVENKEILYKYERKKF